MMKILQIAPQIPFPPTDGGKASIYHTTKSLAERGHEITFMGFVGETQGDYRPFGEYCRIIPYILDTRTKLPQAIGNLFSRSPYNVSKYHSEGFSQEVRSAVRKGEFDLVHVEHVHMAPYGIVCREEIDLPLVLREQNVESVILRRTMETTANPLKKMYFGLQYRRLRRFESKYIGEADYCCAITAADRDRLLQMQPHARIGVVPAGVDEELFRPVQRREKIPHSLCLIGGMGWLPNQDAVRWFLQSVLPRLRQRFPETVVHVFGPAAPEQLLKLGNDRVRFRGFVEDLKSEVQSFQAVVVPVRIGSGMRIRIVESFAMEIPVVTTTVGCEGIEGVSGEHFLVADTAEEFVRVISMIFDQPAVGERLVRNGYALAKSKYRWTEVARQFEEVYLEVLQAYRARRHQHSSLS